MTNLEDLNFGEPETEEEKERRNLDLSLGHHIGTFLATARLGRWNEDHLRKSKEAIQRLKYVRFDEKYISGLTDLEAKLDSVNLSGEVNSDLVDEIQRTWEVIRLL